MKIISIIKYAFTIVGIGMLVGAAFLYQNTSSFLAQATKTEGTVIRLVAHRSTDSTTYSPVVSFIDKGGKTRQFTSTSGSSPAAYFEGEKVGILYIESEPNHASIDGFFSLWGGVTIIGSLGLLFSLVGLAIFAITIFNSRKDAYLKDHGVRIRTDFQAVQLNEGLSVNGRNPFQILTQWLNPETSEIHIFKSANVWFDPTDYVDGKYIEVLIERGNPDKYLVDLSFLPKMAE